ncbi:hypothetical protein BGZ97_013381, partial [Linnemannia gamsii]
MTTSKLEKATVISRPETPSTISRFIQLEEAAKKLLRSTVNSESRTVPNALATIQFGTIEMLVPRDYEGDDTSTTPVATTAISNTAVNNALFNPLSYYPQPCLSAFSKNVDPPSFSVALPLPGARLETTAQLSYCNNLLRTHLSPSLVAAGIPEILDPSQKASVDAILQDKEEQDHIRELTIRVIEEFIADGFKTSDKISEVILLGPSLDQEYHRKLLNCFIAEFETATLLDIDLLQGLVQLAECAGSDYLQPDDLVRILAVLRTRLQDTHRQTAKHHCHLIQALSRLLDVMVEGKVQDLRRVVHHEPLSALLGQLIESPDPYLKHQAAYALQALLHIPNDETRRQYALRQAGNIAMGLLGVASVCKLDLGEFKNGVDHLYKAAGDAHEVGTKIIGGVQALMASGQDIATSVKGGILSGGRQLWYAALHEAQEHIRNGRLADFSRLVFEAPCHYNVEFQWGVCWLLGKIAVDPQWDFATRQHAVEFLRNLYRDDANWTSNDEVLVWILIIIRQIASLRDVGISGHARSLLQDLEKEGNTSKQALHRECLTAPVENFLVKVCLSEPQSSLLLRQVLAIPDVEYVLHRLRTQRMKESENILYIPPQAKPTLTSNDDTLFPLMEKTLEFLAGPGQVLLLLGVSGAGKSTFDIQLEHTLWKDYKQGDPIPLYINIPAINNPYSDLIDKQLRRLRIFSDVQTQELRQTRQFIVICDGYDESRLKKNLYTNNLLNQPEQWQAKLVISCRSQYLNSDYRSRFHPQTANHYAHPTCGLMMEAVIAPFSRVQIEQYIEQYVKSLPMHNTPQDRPAWTTDEYMERLIKIPKLMELVANPFLLMLALEALPLVIGSGRDLSAIRITRVQLYDGFVTQWLEVNKRRLESSTLSDDERLAFELILEGGFCYHGIQFQKDLAAAIYKEQEGQPIVNYVHLHNETTWKSLFFDTSDARTKLLRESSTVTRSGNFFRFIHRSFLEYFYSRTVYDPLDYKPDALSQDRSQIPSPKAILSERNFIKEPSVIQFLAERVTIDQLFKEQLLVAIQDSRKDEQGGQAGANAITILVRAGVRFNEADLRGIRIPEADLYGGQFDSANLEGADLRNANMTRSWFRQANLGKTQMTGVQFGELPYLYLGTFALRCLFSFDGKYLVVSTYQVKIHVYDTSAWAEIASYAGGVAIAISPTIGELAKGGTNNSVELGDILTGRARLILTGHDTVVTNVSYSPDGTQIAIASMDTTVRICSTLSGETFHTLHVDSESVAGIAYSPTGFQLASNNMNKMIQIWNALTGEPLLLLERHPSPILSMAYSPNGLQIASGYQEGHIVLWHAITGTYIQHIITSYGEIADLAYSPDGCQIATCDVDDTIRLWDLQSGGLMNVFTGHRHPVTSVAFSPTGGYIASSSLDGTVRLWKGKGKTLDMFVNQHSYEFLCVDFSPETDLVVTGHLHGEVRVWKLLPDELSVISTGHTGSVSEVAFSPCGSRVASASWDKSVRLWCARTGMSLQVLEGHTESVVYVVFSPDGRRIASASKDKTVRIWDSETGEVGFVLNGHTDLVHGVVFSLKGDQIASCSEDKSVRVWCAKTGEQLFVLEHPKPVNSV